MRKNNSKTRKKNFSEIKIDIDSDAIAVMIAIIPAKVVE